MMSTKLYNTRLLPILDGQLIGRKYKDKEVHTLNPISHYDHFVSKGYEYIILPHYSKLTTSENLLQNNNFTTSYVTSNPTEITFIAYRETILPDTYQHKHDIVMCVYFLQNENEEIERFFDYYLAQGVEKIFMYYCGKLSDRPNLPQRNEVEYLEWNHIFHHYESLTNRLIHNLQIPLYNMFAKKIAMHCNWSIFCDLDEYIKAPNSTLKTYLDNYIKENHLFTQHKFACVNEEKNQIEYLCNGFNSSGRGKTILKGSIITSSDTMNVHRSLKAKDSDLLMFHNKEHLFSPLTVKIPFIA